MASSFTSTVLLKAPRRATPPLTVATVVAEELERAGIRDIPYVPGGPMMPFVQAAFATGWFRFVLCRHEAGAGFMAEGRARVLRRPSVVLVTAGPGVTNLVTPVYVAHSEMTPVFILSAQVSRHVNGLGAAQELDTVALLSPITKRSLELTDPLGARELVRALLTESLVPRSGPVHLSIPSDLWLEEAAR